MWNIPVAIMGNCMRSLFKKLRRKSSSTKTVVLLVVGLDNAGKTSVLNRISNESGQGVVPTMGFRTVSLRHKSYSVKAYDIGGAQQIRSIWSKYYTDALHGVTFSIHNFLSRTKNKFSSIYIRIPREVHGLIYVVDASDISRLTENKIVFGELIAHEHITGKPILLLANKQDVGGAIDELDLVENLDVERVANAMRCPTRVETCSCVGPTEQSAHNTKGIINGYRWLLDTISKNFATLDRRIKQTQNGFITRVHRKLSSSSITPSRSSIRSNPFKPIREIIAEQSRRAPDSSSENLIEVKKKKSSLKKFLATCKNKTAPLGLGERMSKSQHTLNNTGPGDLPKNAQENHNSINLVTLNPTNLTSLEMNDRPKQRPFTAPEISRRQEPLMLYNIPGQVPH